MLQRFYVSGVTASLTLLFCLAMSGCKPNYPKCESDDNCTVKGEVCLNGQCQECREDAECSAKYVGERRECRDGRCEARPECRIDSDCTALGTGLACRDGHCTAACSSDADCAPGQHCNDHRCSAVHCGNDGDCSTGQACLAGICEATSTAAEGHDACRAVHAGDTVNLANVQFEFNKYELTQDAREQLAQVIQCLKQAPASLQVVIEGHCDDRGTQEYNLALGEKRAHAVFSYFKQMGLGAKRFSVRSKGENEPLCTEATDSCFNQNRRVQFIQKSR